MSYASVTVTQDDLELEITGDFFEGQRGKTYGPPEDCYPEEPPSFDIEDITLDGISIYPLLDGLYIGTKPNAQSIIDHLADKAIAKVYEARPEADEPDFDDE